MHCSKLQMTSKCGKIKEVAKLMDNRLQWYGNIYTKKIDRPCKKYGERGCYEIHKVNEFSPVLKIFISNMQTRLSKNCQIFNFESLR